MHVPPPEHRPPGHRLSNIHPRRLGMPSICIQHTGNSPCSGVDEVSTPHTKSARGRPFCGFTPASRSRKYCPGSDGLKRSSPSQQGSAAVALPSDRCPCDDAYPMSSPVAVSIGRRRGALPALFGLPAPCRRVDALLHHHGTLSGMASSLRLDHPMHRPFGAFGPDADALAFPTS